MESDTGLDSVKALPARRPGIDKQHAVEILDALYPQNMAVPTDKHIGFLLTQKRSNSFRPSAGSPSDMNDQEFQSRQTKLLLFRSPGSNVGSINVARHGNRPGQLLEPIKHIATSNVARVNDEIYSLQDCIELGMVVSVRVGENADRQGWDLLQGTLS